MPAIDVATTVGVSVTDSGDGVVASNDARTSPPVSMLAPLVLNELEAAEEVRDLDARRLRSVRAVHRVLLDVLGEVLADGTGVGLGRIGGAHELAVLQNRA